MVVSACWRVALGMLLTLGWFSSLSGAKLPVENPLAAPPPAWQAPLSSRPPRTNIPYFPTTVIWAESAILWFGKNELSLPGKNYIDIRMAYTSQALEIRATVIDYYLWYNTAPKPADDLTQFEALAVYLDTAHDQAGAPQSDDFNFLSAARHYPATDAPQYHRQMRGTGTAWNSAWTASWSDASSMQWDCNPGPNSNTCGRDYGWVENISLPWASLGLSGPPPAGQIWGLGFTLYDRDDLPPAGSVAPQSWPETFQNGAPRTWGELHFGSASYIPPAANPSGSTTIRSNSTTDTTVQDAWNGGGAACSGGPFGSGPGGGSELNHGADANLYIGTEIAPTHFPCFNKTFLRFSLAGIPPNKVILSATLTLHLFGNAGAAGQAKPSWVSLFSISGPWQEMSITWNNAPQAQENTAAAWVNPVASFPGWPGIPYSWDATQAVAEAYEAGLSASLALYGSDTDQHSNKYFVSSQTGDWNLEGRPKLTVAWGDPPQISKKAVPVATVQGGQISYSLRWLGTGQAQTVTDSLPAGLGAATALQASFGTATYDPGSHQVKWSGSPPAGQAVTLTYNAAVQASGPLALTNTVSLNISGSPSAAASATVFVDSLHIFFPVLKK